MEETILALEKHQIFNTAPFFAKNRFIYLMHYTYLFFENWFLLLLSFSSYKYFVPFFVCLALCKLFAFRTRSEWNIFQNFLINKLGSKSTLYFFCKSIEVSCETDRRIAFAISAASLRFPISMNLLNKLLFAIRRFVITLGLIFWDGWICKSQKQVSITTTDLLLIGTNVN